MTSRTCAVILALFICLAAGCTCSRDEKPDFRNVRWGMSKEEVKERESGELMREGNEALTYRIGGELSTVASEGVVEVEVDGEDGAVSHPRVTIEVENVEPEYDIVYAFKDGKLGMAVLHLRDSGQPPSEYVRLLRAKSAGISKETGVPASGVAEYGDSPPKQDPYSSPGEICEGKYALKHVWPTLNGRTDVSIELDEKKFSPSPDCNLSVFYESVEYPVDPSLSDELHEML
ncbi:MAG: hypothetical protein AB1598_05880 [Thermodesulfobacteriota bacterium]